MEETRVLDLLKSLVSTSSKKHNLTSLNSFCRLLQSCPAICDPSESKLTLCEVLCCVRTALFHETYEVRAAGLRAIRYLLKDEQAVQALLKVNLHLLIVRSIDVVLGNDEERHQALRLVRKLLSITPHLFPRAFTRSMIAIAQDGIPHKDNLTRVCWALLAELAILNPEASTLDTRNRAFNIILHAALAPYNQPHSISESLVSTLLYMLNWPSYRPLIRGDLDMQIFVAPFTDSHYTAPLFDERMEKPRHPHMNKHHRADRRIAYSDSSENKNPENRFTTAKNTLISILRSWPGLIYLNDQTPQKDVYASTKNCLESLISMLYLPYNEIRRRLIDLISELLSVPIPDWTNNFEMGLKSLELHQISRDSWKIHDAFVVDEAKSILPPIRSQSRMNLVTNYMALLLLALFHCDIVDALSVVIVSSSSQENSFRATILLGQLLQLSSQYLPPDCISKYLSLPTLISAATSKSEEHRDLANAALTNLDRIHGLTKSSESLVSCSLFLNQILQFCSPKSANNSYNHYQRGTSTRSSSMSSTSSTSTLSSLSSSVMPHLSASGSLRPNSLSIHPNYSLSTSATSNPQSSSNITGSSNASTPSSLGPSIKTPTKNSPSQGVQFPALYSKFTMGKLKFQQYIRADKGDKSFQATIKMMNLSNLNPEQDSGNAQQQHNPHHPQSSQDWQDWDWYVIGCTLNRPSESLKKLSTQLHKAFIKRLIHFFKPSSNQYSSIDINNERARQYCEIGCHLIDFLVECEDFKTVEFLEELLHDISQSITIMDGHNQMTCDMASSSKLISTLSSSYFLFIGRLSSTQKGYQLLERTGIISLIGQLVQLSIQNPSSPAEVHVRLIISCFDYTKEFNGSRKLLEKFLFEHPEESIRIYATNFIRVLLRAGVKDFSMWCVELLVRQLNNSSRIVHHVAAEILDEACDLSENLEGLIALKFIITSSMSTSDSATSKLSYFNGSNKMDSPMMNHHANRASSNYQSSVLASGQDFRHKYTRMSVIHILRSSGDSGVALLSRFASCPSGLKYLMETPHKSPSDQVTSTSMSSQQHLDRINESPVNGNDGQAANRVSEFDFELDQWTKIYNYRYVKIVEEVLNNSLTYHQKSEDGRYGRRIDKINPLTKNSDLPSHLYGQLAQHPDGVQIIIGKNLLDPIYKIIKSPPKDLETSELSVLKFKAALWIIGHVGSSEGGYQLLDEVEIVSKIIEVAKSATVLSLRGTAFYVLGLLASTEDGAEQLKMHNWAAMRKGRLALPLTLDMLLIKPIEELGGENCTQQQVCAVNSQTNSNPLANSKEASSTQIAGSNNNEIGLANALIETRTISSSTQASGQSCSTNPAPNVQLPNSGGINTPTSMTYYEMHKRTDCLYCCNLSEWSPQSPVPSSASPATLASPTTNSRARAPAPITLTSIASLKSQAARKISSDIREVPGFESDRESIIGSLGGSATTPAPPLMQQPNIEAPPVGVGAPPNLPGPLTLISVGAQVRGETIEVLAANFSSAQLLQVRREVLRLSYFLVTGNFSSSFFESVEKVENSLLNLKRKYGLLFQHDLCLYSDVCQQLATYNFPLLSRRFLQELFLDITFDPLNEHVKRILNKGTS